MATTQIKDGFDGGSDNQLKVNTDGSINVNEAAGGGNPSVGPTSTTAPTSATEIAGIDPSGNLRAVSVDANGFVNVQGVSEVTGTVNTHEAGLNSFQTSQYVIGMTEIQITPTPLTNRSSISLKVVATGSNAIFITATVGTALTQGYPLYNGDNLQMDLTPSGNIYAVATASGQNLYVLEIA